MVNKIVSLDQESGFTVHEIQRTDTVTSPVKDLLEEDFICPGCRVANPASRWNDKTLPNCLNRSERRRYVPIEKKLPGKWYQCPHCGGKVKSEALLQCKDTGNKAMNGSQV